MNPNIPVTTEGASTGATEAARDERSMTMELVISDLLRWGVIAAAGVIVIGMAVSFFHHPDYFLSTDALQRLTSPKRGPHSLEDVLAGIRGIHGNAIEMAGLLCLIALPVARVGFSLAIFAARKDRRYVWLSGAVLALLLVSFILGRAE